MKKQLLLFIGVLISTSIFAQSELKVFEDFMTTAGTQNLFYKNIVKTDGSGNIYVSGATRTANGTYDLILAKLNPSGAVQWVQEYNGADNSQDFATALFVDGSGNVYVTGSATNDTVNHLSDLVLIKYNSGGTQQWVYTYDGVSHLPDAGADLQVDGSGNVYVTGGTTNGFFNTDILAIKVNSSGVQQWVTTYDHTSHLNDAGIKIKAGSTTIYVTAIVQNAPSDYIMGELSLSASTGSITGATATGTGSTDMDVVNDVVQAGGYLYIAGGAPSVSNGYNFDIIKLDSYLNVVWERIYDGAAHLDDVAKGIRVNAAGDVYVTGYSKTASEGSNYLTLKYNSSGSLIWTRTYNDTLNGDDDANAMEMDSNEDIYVTGNAYTDELTGVNYHTIKYDTAGTVIWSVDFDGSHHLSDKASNMALDLNENLIVTGSSETAPGVYEYATVKYVQKEIITPTDFNSEQPLNSFLYYANKGQLIGTDTNTVPGVRFYTNSTYPAYYFKDDTMSMVFSRMDTIAATDDTLHRIDLSFSNCNKPLKIHSLEEQPGYLNYFLGHCPYGITGIHGNQKLVITNLYNNIDLVYSSNYNGMKYYFVIKPGGDPDDIKMQYTGATSTNLAGNILSIRGIVDTISFDRPFMYQINASNDTIANSDYLINWHNYTGNKYGIDVHAYDSSKVLIIEVNRGHKSILDIQNINWSTFYGGAGDDELTESTTDPGGNLFIAGQSRYGLFPTTPGVYQGTNAGHYDALALKFNPAGQIVWSTYIGGTSAEYVGGISVDASGNVFVVGTTYSSDFPTAIGNPGGGATYYANNASTGGFSDGFIAKFNSTGTLAPWRTYYGGAANENFNACRIDASGNLFVVGQTGSSGFPVQAAGAQYTQTCISAGAGDEDGFILKFNNSGVRQWCSCYGGTSSGEYIDELDFDSSGNLFVVGTAKTPGTGFPTLNPVGSGDMYYGTLAGSSDIFIAKFDNSGVRKYATLFGGNGYDYSSSIVTNSLGEIFVSGTTGSPSLPIVQGGADYYQDTQGGPSTYDAFLLKLLPNLHLDWGTMLGGSGNDWAYGLNIDAHNILYVTGYTDDGDFPMPATNPPNTYNTGFNGGPRDAYIAAFDVDGQKKYLWGTFLGGSKDDVGYKVVIDINDNLFAIGKTNSDSTSVVDFPLDDGGGIPTFQPYSAGNLEGFITRFNTAPITLAGINEINSDENELSVYPNPANNVLNISYTNKKKSSVKFILYNLLGEIVQSIDMGKQSGSIFCTFDVTDLAEGIYFVQVQSNNETINKKFIKN